MEKQIEINGVNFNYSVEGEGIPVVLMHGWGCNRTTLASIEKLLVPYFKVYNVDFPGFGKSTEPQTVGGNICRSPAGQGVMERIVDERGLNDRIFIDSAGISSYHSGDLPDQRMRVHATRRGLNLTHRSRQVCSDDFERFDLILAMDDSNYDHLRRLANSPEEMDKVKRIASFFRQYRHWDCIPDPYYGGSEGFENVLDLLDDACQNIADQIETKQI